MGEAYRVVRLSSEEQERLIRVRDDLVALSGCEVPSVNAAARAALAQVAQALNGQGLTYELYTTSLPAADE
jgi:hypothetical protein